MIQTEVFVHYMQVVDGHDERGNSIYFVYKTLWLRYRLQFLQNHFQNFNCKLLIMRRNRIDFEYPGSKIKVNFWTLPVKLCGFVGTVQATIFDRSLSNFISGTNTLVSVLVPVHM